MFDECRPAAAGAARSILLTGRAADVRALYTQLQTAVNSTRLILSQTWTPWRPPSVPPPAPPRREAGIRWLAICPRRPPPRRRRWRGRVTTTPSSRPPPQPPPAVLWSQPPLRLRPPNWILWKRRLRSARAWTQSTRPPVKKRWVRRIILLSLPLLCHRKAYARLTTSGAIIRFRNRLSISQLCAARKIAHFYDCLFTIPTSRNHVVPSRARKRHVFVGGIKSFIFRLQNGQNIKTPAGSQNGLE